MAHQSGITADQELEATFSKVREDNFDQVRAIKVVIDNDTVLKQVGVANTSSDMMSVWPEVVTTWLSATDCCYILMRSDAKNSNNNFNWILLSYVPDNAKIREKMLYASTRATLKKTFALVTDELFGTTTEDMTAASYQAQVASDAADVPLTMAEREIAEIRLNEGDANIGTTTKKAVISGSLGFPIASDVLDAFQKCKDGAVCFIQIAIDLKKEEVILDTSDNTTKTNECGAKCPSDSPRYIITAYDHTDPNTNNEKRSLLFAYCCPGYSVPIKERMCYSSCKNHVVSAAEKAGLVLDKKVEVSAPEEMNIAFFHDSLYEKTVVNDSRKFAKPTRPGRATSSPRPRRAN